MECSPFFCSWDVEVRVSIPKAALAVGSAATTNMAAPPMRTSRRDTELRAFDFSLLTFSFLSAASRSDSVEVTRGPFYRLPTALHAEIAGFGIRKGCTPLESCVYRKPVHFIQKGLANLFTQ